MTENSSPSGIPLVPTLAIGVGMGGVSVVKEFNSFVEQNGIMENYRFIAIDSNIDDLNKIIESAVNTSKIEITDHQYDVANLKKNCPYLHKWVAMQKGGALQERVYGRFLLDLHREEITRAITTHIHDLANIWQKKEGGGERRGHIAIWVIHSLGGGTGSGSSHPWLFTSRKLSGKFWRTGNYTAYIWSRDLSFRKNITDLSAATFTKRYLPIPLPLLKRLKHWHQLLMCILSRCHFRFMVNPFL
jgi:hypothetical protein